jgi:hypothetical protein
MQSNLVSRTAGIAGLGDFQAPGRRGSAALGRAPEVLLPWGFSRSEEIGAVSKKLASRRGCKG